MAFWSNIRAYKNIDIKQYPFSLDSNGNERVHFYIGSRYDGQGCDIYGGISSSNMLTCQPSNNQWYHWGFVSSFSGTLQNTEVYFNGLPAGFTFSVNETMPGDAWTTFTVTGQMPTKLSDLRFYSRALTDGDMMDLVASSPPQPPLPPSPSPSPPPPLSPPPSPPWPPASVSVVSAVNTSWASVVIGTQTNGRLPPGFMGISFGKEVLALSILTPQNAPLIQLFKNLGPGTVRIGAATVNAYTWDPTGPGGQLGYTSPADVDNLGGFLAATGWNVLYGLNGVSPVPISLGSAYTPPDTANTVLEAAYVAGALGASIASFEIGNEPDLYARQGLKYAQYVATDHIADFVAYTSAIAQAGIVTSFSGPAVAWDTAWALQFGDAVKSSIVQLTQHHYLNSNTATVNIATLLNPNAVYNPSFETIDRLNAASLGLAQGFRISEANTFYCCNRAGVANAFASALWVISYSFSIAKTNASGINFMSAQGLLGYSPIPIDPALPLGYAPAAEYYGMLLVASMGPGVTLDTSTAGTAPALFAYATFNTTYTVALVNTDAIDICSVTLSLPDDFYATTAVLLTAASTHAVSGVTFGGGPLMEDGSWVISEVYSADGNTVTIPPGSALLVSTAKRVAPGAAESPPSPEPPPPVPPSPGMPAAGQPASGMPAAGRPAPVPPSPRVAAVPHQADGPSPKQQTVAISVVLVSAGTVAALLAYANRRVQRRVFARSQ